MPASSLADEAQGRIVEPERQVFLLWKGGDAMLMIRNRVTGEAIPLLARSDGPHPEWVHRQCVTHSEAELKALIEHLDVAEFLRQSGAENAMGILLEIPPGALAWKGADPFQPARWLFDEEDVVEAAELDPEIVVRVPET
jgi:hypothetical protein